MRKTITETVDDALEKWDENNPGSDDYPSVFRRDSVNSYVGGDAYNYIINGTYSTSYFVLALVFTVFACSMLILKKID